MDGELRYLFRMTTEVVFLAVFFMILWSGFVLLWLLIFAAGVIGSIAFGRFYCGWICPQNTLGRPIGWIYEKLGKKRVKTPSLLRKGWGRWIALAALIIPMIYIRTTGKQFPVFSIVILAGVAFFLVFEEEAFHKRVCPYGAILSISSKRIRYGVSVNKSECISCGKCQNVCPNDTIVTLDPEARKIENPECLTCFRCEDICPVSAIEYRDIGDRE